MCDCEIIKMSTKNYNYFCTPLGEKQKFLKTKIKKPRKQFAKIRNRRPGRLETSLVRSDDCAHFFKMSQLCTSNIRGDTWLWNGQVRTKIWKKYVSGSLRGIKYFSPKLETTMVCNLRQKSLQVTLKYLCAIIFFRQILQKE